jgi:hypothetical protein
VIKVLLREEVGASGVRSPFAFVKYTKKR